MEKVKLTRFIDKYHLGGNVNAVVINSKSNKLSTRFITGDKALLGELSVNNFTFEDTELGVYDTEQLSKLLSVLSDDVTFNLSESSGKAIALEVNDQHSSVNFMLSDKSVINQPPALKQLPEFQVRIKVDTQFINRFISGKGALPDTDTFTIANSDGKVEVIIGFSNVQTNRVTIPVEAKEIGHFDVASFNATMFASILNANKECNKAVLKVSSQGISTISFEIDDYHSEYYLVASQQVN